MAAISETTDAFVHLCEGLRHYHVFLSLRMNGAPMSAAASRYWSLCDSVHGILFLTTSPIAAIISTEEALLTTSTVDMVAMVDPVVG